MEETSPILNRYSPNKESLHQRYTIYKLLKSSIYRSLEKKLIKVTVYGSLPLRTFLEDGDIDITVITTPEDSQFPEHILEKIKIQLLKDFEITKIELLQAEVPLLKFQIYLINIDISINQIGGVRSLIFLEEISRLFPKHLLKKSIVLFKAWATYFSRILGSQMGLFGTYALEVMIVFIVNTFPECRSSPFSVIRTMIEYFSVFDWENWVITCVGTVPIMKWTGSEETQNEKLQLTADKVRGMRDELRSVKTEWVTKFVNIADPVLPGNNLGRRIEFSQFERIKFCFSVALEIVSDFGVERLFRKKRSQVGVNDEMFDEVREKTGTAVSYFANSKKLKSALASCLAVMDPSFPQNY